MPALARASAVIAAWVMVAGCATRLSTPPSDSARVNQRKPSTKARAAADSVKDALHDARPDFDKAAAGALAQRVFELAAAPGVAAADLTKLIAALNDTRRLEAKFDELAISKRKLELLEKKAAEADAARGAVQDEQLTPEEKMARIKAVFGIA